MYFRWEPEIVKVMMELGNNVVNDIYERNYKERFNSSNENESLQLQVETIQIRHATSDCNINIRETWIKAKYVNKQFIAPIEHLMSPGCIRYEGITCLQDIIYDDVNGWYVRRKRKEEQNILAERSAKPSKSEERISKLEQGKNNFEYDDINRALNCDARDKEVDLACGYSFEKTEIFSSDMILYKATSVQNLPIMLYAVVSGARKTWKNSNDLDRTPFHRAVLSVSRIFN